MLISFDVAGNASISFYAGLIQTGSTLEVMLLYEAWSAYQTNDSG
jgi:hypothetical protein